ncbi:TPA: hypothetical protein ACGO8F_001022 [Streptococcus suis]
MAYRNLKSSDRTFIKGQTDRLVQQMNNNAEYLATVQAYEAAKARMNEAYLAMELEDNPEKKLKLAKLVEKYTAQAQNILDNWEERNRRAEKVARTVKLILWLTLLFVVSFLFPVNIMIALIFAIWFYRNYLSPSRESLPHQAPPIQTVISEEERYEDWLTDKILTLSKDKREWTEYILSKYEENDYLEEVAAGNGEIDEKDKEDGRKLLQRYRDILVDIEKLPDSDQKTYYLDFHQELIADLEDVFEQLHIKDK